MGGRCARRAAWLCRPRRRIALPPGAWWAGVGTVFGRLACGGGSGAIGSGSGVRCRTWLLVGREVWEGGGFDMVRGWGVRRSVALEKLGGIWG